jgi:PTH1 family peptidyl-tRNA hydrolase
VKLILFGLGNPGKRYDHTRHNLGHWFVNRFAQSADVSFKQQRDFEVSMLNYSNTDIILLKSLNFMNCSGNGLARFLSLHLCPKDFFMIVHDELNLPFGRIKLSSGKSDGGHRGVQHVNQVLEFLPTRLRLGIDSPLSHYVSISEFVLTRLSTEEIKSLDTLFPKLLHILKLLLAKGLSQACNYANRHPVPSQNN